MSAPGSPVSTPAGPVGARANALVMQRGMTLIELMVTLLIVSLVAAVITQALVQIARIERLLEGGQLGAMADSVRAEWVRDAFGALLPGEAGLDERLTGSPNEVTGLSADAPQLPLPGLARVRFRLVFQERTDTTELQLDDPALAPAGSSMPSRVLLAWPGRFGRFRYLDAQGSWQDSWSSPPGSATPAMPLAIALETGLPGLPILIAALRASAIALPTRRQLESM